MAGRVYLIGAGPGDAGLITRRGMECIREAESIIYDNLVNEELLAYAREGVRLFYAGKKGGDHFLRQEEINALLVAEASRGLVVARLKGGDPFIFGRGGEEAQVLREAGISFEVVPGVTAAIAVPAYAGIPLTHRDFTSTVAFVTGHESEQKNARHETNINWEALAGIGSLVFLMGVKNLGNVTKRLIEGGKPPTTPAALIRQGTTSEQESLVADLGTIFSEATVRNFSPPAVLVVGEVVTLREQLNWFENKPLLGRGVMITRPRRQAGEFAKHIAAYGGRPLFFPVIEIEPVPDFSHLDAAVEKLTEYSWVIFTSANGVRYFFERLFAQNKDARALGKTKIAAIGPMTAREIGRFGLRVDLLPRDFLSEGVVAAFATEDLRGKKVLLPRAQQARDIIPQELEKRGATVEVIAVYRTLPSGKTKDELMNLLAAPFPRGNGQDPLKTVTSPEAGALSSRSAVSVITFTSPSTVSHFLEIVGEWGNVPAGIKTACIGPITAHAMRERGIPIDIMQDTYTIRALAEAIADHFR